jgi:selenide,water dikinase
MTATDPAVLDATAPANPHADAQLGRRLTQYSPGGGCACKLPQRLLDDVLSTVRPAAGSPGASEGLRVGLGPTADDAAVLDLPGLEGRSLVVTTDFLTPVVDDPYQWGRAAATSALSDVYAMGGRPLLALNLLGWPAELDQELLAAVLRGGADAVAAAGAVLAGGHSIVDPAPKYGLAVVGEVAHDALLRKDGGRPGDRLVLTKPLGVGVTTTAIKRGQASDADIDAAVATMTRSNASAAAVAVAAGLRGGTDVTGYGLLGHLHEMGRAAGLGAVLWPDAVPVLPGVPALARAGCVPDGSRRTLADALAAGWFDPGAYRSPVGQLLADAQTSGGLLLAVPPGQLDTVLGGLGERGELAAAVVGELVDDAPGRITTEPDHTAPDQAGTGYAWASLSPVAVAGDGGGR